MIINQKKITHVVEISRSFYSFQYSIGRFIQFHESYNRIHNRITQFLIQVEVIGAIDDDDDDDDDDGSYLFYIYQYINLYVLCDC